MRFSLRELLLLPPAFLLCMLWTDGSALTPHYDFMVCETQTHVTASDLAMTEMNVGSGKVPATVFDQWLAGRLPANHPVARAAAVQPVPDPWGNPLRCVRDVKVSDGDVEEIGVYSMGRDGVSRTRGNDPDDINSWDPNCWVYYKSDMRQRTTILDVIEASMLTPFVWAALVGIVWLCTTSIANRQKQKQAR